jgi:hypothetical protein
MALNCKTEREVWKTVSVQTVSRVNERNRFALIFLKNIDLGWAVYAKYFDIAEDCSILKTAEG